MGMAADRKRSRRLIGLAVLGLCLGALPLWAADAPLDFDYDIFRISDTLALWLDVVPILDQTKMEDLLSGLDIAVELNVNLERPRFLVGARTLVHRQFSLLISHPLAEDTYWLRIGAEKAVEYKFSNQLNLSDYLADSLVFRIGPTTDLAERTKIRLSLAITCNSMSPHLLGAVARPPDGLVPARQRIDNGIFDRLFELFRETIGFGRTSYRVQSPVFDLDRLPSGPP